jgi:hypothetical protein
MIQPFKGNEDWLKRKHGQVRTKGAMAAERASAGLGTSDDDALGPPNFRPPPPVMVEPGLKDRPAARG